MTLPQLKEEWRNAERHRVYTARLLQLAEAGDVVDGEIVEILKTKNEHWASRRFDFENAAWQQAAGRLSSAQ